MAEKFAYRQIADRQSAAIEWLDVQRYLCTAKVFAVTHDNPQLVVPRLQFNLCIESARDEACCAGDLLIDFRHRRGPHVASVRVIKLIRNFTGGVVYHA